MKQIRNLRISQRFCFIAAAYLILAFSAWQLLSPGGLPSLLYKVLIKGDQRPVFICTGMDTAMDELAPNGNIFLQFKGFEQGGDPEKTGIQGRELASIIYFRTVYHLWPRRVYTGPEERIISRGDEMIREPFSPEPEWLKKRHITRIITFHRDSKGNIRPELREINSTSTTGKPESPNAKITSNGAFWLIIYLASMLAIGAVILAWVEKTELRLSFMQWFSRIMVFGIAGTAFFQFWWMLAGLPAGRIMLAGQAMLAAGLLGVAMGRKSLPLSFPVLPFVRYPRERMLALPALLLMLFCIICVFAMALGMPLFDVDSYTLWGLKAKVLYTHGMAGNDYFQQLNYGYSHLDYPLLGPSLTVGIYSALGGIHDQLGKLPYALAYLGFTGLAYTLLRRKLDALAAVLAATVLSAAPAMVYWAGGGTMDTMLAMFYLGSTAYLALWVESGKGADLRSAIICSGAMCFAKNEGIALFILNAAAVSVVLLADQERRHRLPTFIAAFAAVMLLYLPWFLWARDIPRVHENYGGRIKQIFSPEAWSRIPEISAVFAKQFTSFNRWSINWLLLLIIPFVTTRIKHNCLLCCLSMMLMLHLLLYFFVFMITPWTVSWLADTALERLLLHLMPALIMLAAIALRPKNGDIRANFNFFTKSN